jgi:hypothetical protein
LTTDEMAAISPNGMSEGHRLAYKKMCEDAGDDEIVLDIIQYSAAHMAKTQINMSADLILTEAKREFQDNPVDNVASERVFGFIGFRHKLAWNENVVRTNAHMMWRMNGVSEWLEAMQPAQRDKLICAVSSTKVKNALLRRQKAREEAIEDYKAQEQEEWIAKGTEKMQQRAAACNSCDIWTVSSMSGRIAEYPGGPRSKEKLEALKQQWRALKTWANKGKLTFPFPNMPSKGGVIKWIESVKTLLQHPNTEEILAYREQCRQSPQQDMVQIIDKVKQVHVEQVCVNDLKQWMEAAVGSADSEVHRSRRHRDNDRAHAVARGDVPDAGAAGDQQDNAQGGAAGDQQDNVQDNEQRDEAAADDMDPETTAEQDEEQSIKNALKDPIEPEQLFNWSAEAEGEMVEDF